MNERYIHWYTRYLDREFEMLAFGDGGRLPLILFPTSFGSYYQNKDFGLVGSIAGYVDDGRVTICCPDAIDLESFYNKGIHPTDRMRTHNAYENVIVRDFSSFFDGYHDDNIYFNSPYQYLPNINDPWKYNHMAIILGTGDWDNTRQESLRLSEALNSKGIQHWLDDRKWCGHDWNYWREMLPFYLSKF